MTTLVRVAVIGYMFALTLALLVGQWPLEGPRLFGANGHGVHAGDLAVLAVTAAAAVVVLKPRVSPPGRGRG